MASSPNTSDGIDPDSTVGTAPDADALPTGPTMNDAANVDPDLAVADVLASATVGAAHEDLLVRDTVAGLRAELETLKARLELLETTDVAKAFARVDQLEEEREARLHELRLLVQDHRDHIKSAQKEIASVKQSSTWRVGSAVIRPLSKITGRLPR